MNFKHLRPVEKYQIHALLKAHHGITQIASLIRSHNSALSRGLRRNVGSQGYRPKQAWEMSDPSIAEQPQRQHDSALGERVSQWLVARAMESRANCLSVAR